MTTLHKQILVSVILVTVMIKVAFNLMNISQFVSSWGMADYASTLLLCGVVGYISHAWLVVPYQQRATAHVAVTTKPITPLKVAAVKMVVAESFTTIDALCWVLVVMFFCGSALIMDGNLNWSFVGAGGIIVEMFFISASIAIVIKCLQDMKGIGTLIGFITNGPEALCVLVGLIVGDILFAASTPLGSNFMNPVLLVLAALLNRACRRLIKARPAYTAACLSITAALAVSFYILPGNNLVYAGWVVVSFAATLVLFIKRPEEEQREEDEDETTISRWWLLPAIIVLVVAGYFLDPVVSFAAGASNAPKGVIGFFVLATLTSWPEFKSTMILLRQGRVVDAILNIAVSNVTNVWLANGGVAYYLVRGAVAS